MSSKDTTRPVAGEQGFALALTLWGLGLISLIVMAVMISERYRILSESNVLENTRAEALATAGINRAREQLIFAFLTNGAAVSVDLAGQPRQCRLSAEGRAVIAIQSEAGKIDINAATPELLAALLRSVGAGLDEAERLAAAIITFRHPSTSLVERDIELTAYQRDHRDYGPKHAPFESILELDQVIGMRPDLLARILPHITVYSHAPGVDPALATPELLAALAGSPQVTNTRAALISSVPSQFLASGVSRSFTIHAEVRTSSGSEFTQEAVIEIGTNDPPDIVREWRRGDARFRDRLMSVSDNEPPC